MFAGTVPIFAAKAGENGTFPFRNRSQLPSPACGRGAGGEGGARQNSGLVSGQPPKVALLLVLAGWPRHFSAIGKATSVALSEKVSGVRSNERTPGKCLLWLRHPDVSPNEPNRMATPIAEKRPGHPEASSTFSFCFLFYLPPAAFSRPCTAARWP